MAIKSLKEKKSTTPKSGIEKSIKADSKTSKKKDLDEEDDLDEEEVNDDWGKEEEDTNWDPDFEEFDVPKKSSKFFLTSSSVNFSPLSDIKALGKATTLYFLSISALYHKTKKNPQTRGLFYLTIYRIFSFSIPAATYFQLELPPDYCRR